MPAWARFVGRRDALLEEYGARLRAMHSALAEDEETLRSCVEHARSILDECAAGMREGRVVSCEDAWAMASEIGARRAAGNVHPVESLRAAAVLIELTVRTLQEICADDPAAVPLLCTAVLTLNQSISLRMHVASIAYDRFLFDRFQRAQADGVHTLAREIHDHVGNGVSLAHRQLELYEVLHSEGCGIARDRVARARLVLTETLDTTRRLIAGLRARVPVTGLREALEAFVASADSPSTEVDVVVEGDENRLSHDVAGELYTVVREALRNALQHAGASRISALVTITPWRVVAVVEDNGAGFDRRRRAAGHGLASMTERTTLLGGELTITSARGAGTRLEVTIPLMEAGHAIGA
ncbi:histidine kinase [Saccharothrix sp. S26]|uniref:sensor histidine kinase n=1 Tax=Saccharothrix sp. S26 TaxID=2907215 RepID=UPI001F42CDD5|nr:ATP-binding protein [Saccharothrix sp. S26]MCE6998205.1 histidine kinase [Saccharothrix sp. S26]